MMTGYRRRFVAITMALIALVLLLALVMQGVYVCRSEYQDMRRTMGMVLEPWRMVGDGFRPEDMGDRPEPPDGERPPGGENPSPDRDNLRSKGIVTAFYDSEADTVTLMPSAQLFDEAEITAAARAAAQRDDSFGRLAEGYYYLKEGGGESLKIALTDVSYLRSNVLRSLGVLAGIYALALCVFYFISRWLSRLAARPMEQAVEMERQFVADISHDLKTPITVVLANDAILRSNPDVPTGEQLQWIDASDAAARNMLNMVEQMLTLSSLESARRTVEKTAVNLSACVEKSVLQLESVAYDRGVTVESDVAPGVSVSATEDYCMRILSGLIENALKYEPDGGTVYVSLTRERRRALLTVRNAGSIIAPEDLPHVFERFYRGDKARSGSEGHGLGLPIVKGVCDLLGAEIRAQSDAQTGTAFTVTFETL